MKQIGIGTRRAWMVAALLALAGLGLVPGASGQDKARERVLLQVSDDNEKN